MADDNLNATTDNPPIPDGYEEVTIPVPLQQQLFFVTHLNESGYLPVDQTDDEDNHLSKNGYAGIVSARKYQVATIRQGEAGNYTFTLNFLKPNTNWSGIAQDDLSDFISDKGALIDKIIAFEGKDSSGAYFWSDEGFDVTQANQGILTWNPSPELAQSSGHFKNAHFVIQNPDRTKAIATLDFDLNVIPNTVAYPKHLAFYVTELNRALAEFKQSIESGQKQQAFYQALYVGIMQNNIAQANETLEKAITEGSTKVENAIKDGQTKIDAAVGDANSKIKEFKDSLEELEAESKTNSDNLATMKTDIESNHVLTDENATETIQKLLDEGKVSFAEALNILISNGDLNFGQTDPIVEDRISSRTKLLKEANN